MRQRWPAPLLGATMFLLLLLNTLALSVPVYLTIFAKRLAPAGSAARGRLSRWLAWLAQRWAHNNAAMATRLLPTRWNIRRSAALHADGQYLVCANHQSWNDILVLIKAFGRDAPFFKFFLKRELIWVPLLGPIWWGLDYPFMRRHTAAQIAARPELRRQDLEATQRACRAFRHEPALILNFLEGTRFTREKHQAQRSPYRHLLRPKAGGFAFALATLGDRIQSVIDVTIVYPGGPRGLWDFLCGRVPEVRVDLREIAIPPPLRRGDYEGDADYRRQFQSWISALWADKDERITRMLEHGACAPS